MLTKYSKNGWPAFCECSAPMRSTVKRVTAKKWPDFVAFLGAVFFLGLHAAISADGSGTEGCMKAWQPITMEFTGPRTHELSCSPNPFLDYRLDAEFVDSIGRSYRVPGYFAGNGSGGAKGDKWHVKFTPDSAGAWVYSISFRQGANVAITTDADAGTSAGYMDGDKGSFTVHRRDPDAPAFLSKGKLAHIDDRFYLKTLGDGRYWIKGGTNSPENFLGYKGFDDTHAGRTDHPEFFHDYDAHRKHWKHGDIFWTDKEGDDGKGIIGSINYLAAKNVNCIYILLHNNGGDGRDVIPFAGPIVVHLNPNANADGINDNRWYDISKLYQWDLVFSHAQQSGIALHLLFGEGERANKTELDGAKLQVERKLFYREMIARFGHHNGIMWNICEEYNGEGFTESRVRDFAAYIKAIDPYDHPLTVHNQPYQTNGQWLFYGEKNLDLTSIQRAGVEGFAVSRFVEENRNKARNSGKIVPISIDENLFVTAEDTDSRELVDMGGWSAWHCGQTYVRKHMIYPVYFSGGHQEHILSGTLATDDFSLMERFWGYLWNARKFMEENLPFWEMEPHDELLSKSNGHGDVFAKPGEIYAIYLPNGGSGAVDLTHAGDWFEGKWYNPRTGRFEGGIIDIKGGVRSGFGAPPADTDNDWVLLIKSTDSKGDSDPNHGL